MDDRHKKYVEHYGREQEYQPTKTEIILYKFKILIRKLFHKN